MAADSIDEPQSAPGALLHGRGEIRNTVAEFYLPRENSKEGNNDAASARLDRQQALQRQAASVGGAGRPTKTFNSIFCERMSAVKPSVKNVHFTFWNFKDKDQQRVNTFCASPRPERFLKGQQSCSTQSSGSRLSITPPDACLYTT